MVIAVKSPRLHFVTFATTVYSTKIDGELILFRGENLTNSPSGKSVSELSANGLEEAANASSGKILGFDV